MERRGFLSGLGVVGAGVFSLFFNRVAGRASTLTSAANALDTWDPPSPLRSSLLAAGSHLEASSRIWQRYELEKPNKEDTAEAFCRALLHDWEHDRPAYVWRTYGAARRDARHVYVLPARFVIAHPAFLPDFPNGFYRIDPTLDADEAPVSIHPSVFTRILPAEAVDVYPPPADRDDPLT